MDREHKIIWEKADEKLKNMLSKVNYDRWISVIHCNSVSGEELHLAVENGTYISWLEDNYLSLIRKVITALGGEELKIILEVDENCCETPKEKPEPEKTPSVSLSGLGKRKPSHNLNPDYTFDSYVVGSPNEFVHATALAAAKPPSRTYNPLFIHGEVGLGKTHLMQAIGNHVASKKPRAKICYTTCETFTNKYIDALQNKKVTEFRKKYRKIDMLLIDDIQFLDGKKQLQEEFFHTFNALFESHKQIVLTSDRKPSEMAGLAPRLISRFEWGLVTELKKPDKEVRAAILRKKAEHFKSDISHELLDYLAQRISSNVRRLEAALTRVTVLMSLNPRLSLQEVDEELRDLFDKESAAVVSVDHIQRTVAEHFGLRQADLTGKKRSKDIAWPRQIAMHLSRTMTKQSFPVIGEQFSRNHATILYAHSQVSERAENDRALQQTIAVLKDKVRKNAGKASR